MLVLVLPEYLEIFFWSRHRRASKCSTYLWISSWRHSTGKSFETGTENLRRLHIYFYCNMTSILIKIIYINIHYDPLEWTARGGFPWFWIMNVNFWPPACFRYKSNRWKISKLCKFSKLVFNSLLLELFADN